MERCIIRSGAIYICPEAKRIINKCVTDLIKRTHKDSCALDPYWEHLRTCLERPSILKKTFTITFTYEGHRDKEEAKRIIGHIREQLENFTPNNIPLHLRNKEVKGGSMVCTVKRDKK